MIAIRQRVLDDIVDQARAEAPSECCGLLIGSVRMGEPAVEASVRTRNIRKSATRYQVDPAQHFAAIRHARAEGREIIGAYHSHPQSAPIPSPTDVAEATYPDFVYLIVSLLDAGHPEVRAFRIDGGRFTAVPLVAVP